MKKINILLAILSILLLTGCTQSIVKYQCIDNSFADSPAGCTASSCSTTECPKLNCTTCPIKIEYREKIVEKPIEVIKYQCIDGTIKEKSSDCSEILETDITEIGANEYVEIVSFTGKGNQNTESFNINSNKAKITARTWGVTGSGSYSSISLESETQRYLSGASLSISTRSHEEGLGETIVRDLDKGAYYISVISGINWEVKVYEFR